MAPHRLFFGLRPDRPVRELLAGLPRQYGLAVARAQAIDDIHMTLVFLGGVDEASLERARALAARISVEPFRVALEHLEYWPRARVVCARPRHPAEALMQLQQKLSDALREQGFPIEHRRYRPHVTVGRKADPFPRIELSPVPTWRATHFLLYASVSDGRLPRYRPIAEYSLGGS